MSGPTSEEVAALGKNLSPADTRTAEQVAATPFDQAAFDRVLADPDALEGKTSSEIAALMGMAEIDKSEMTAPEGDAPVHELNRRAETAAAAAPAPTVETPVAPAPAAPSPAPAAPAPTPAAAAPVTAASPAPVPPAATPGAVPVVLTRDGRPVIDYAVLQGERRANKELREENARLQADLATRAGTPATPAPTDATDEPAQLAIDPAEVVLYTDEEITEMRANYPANLVNRWIADNKIAVTTYQTVISDRDERAREVRTNQQQSVVDFTDTHPLLGVWMAGETEADQRLWQEAVAQDAALQANPLWQGKPWQTRMEQAARNVAVLNGIEYKPVASVDTPAPSQVPKPQPSLQDRAQAALAAAAAAPIIPTSHSDLPGGAPAGQSEPEQVSMMSASQIEAKLENMSPAAIEKWMLAVG